MHRVITEREKETNRDTLDKVIEEWPDDRNTNNNETETNRDTLDKVIE